MPKKTREEVNEQILSALQEKLKGRKMSCLLCGVSKWQISERLGKLYAVELENFSNDLGRSGFPLLVLTCDNCGFSLLVNLISLGLADDFGLEIG